MNQEDSSKILHWVNNGVVVAAYGELVSEQQSHMYLNQINVEKIDQPGA